ncbi:hypothetical protein BU15DRAFT_78021 [Melanogaster broomeanus]|nr:hypothetical protein BU15DRAFT_78021 [Melanogaster broomeanus]
MAYAIELDDGTIIEVPDLATDGSNWKTYRDYILYVAAIEDFVQQLDGADAKPVDVTQHELKAWDQRNTMAKLIISITIPDSLLMCIMHLETAHEQFKHLTNRFETKTSDVTQREATCNPRTTVDMRQKLSECTRTPRKHEATANKLESSAVKEPRNAKCHKQEREARGQGRVEKRVRRGRKAAERTSEQGAAAREPGEETADKTTRSVSLAVTPSSQDDNSRDMGVPCTRVTPQEPQSTSPVANDAAADAVNPNATSAGPPEPAGTSHDLQDEPHESTGSYPGTRGENDDSRGPGTHCTHITAQRPQAATGEASADTTNPNATSVGPPEPVGASREPPDEPADGVNLAPPASSPHEEPAASAPRVCPSRGSERARPSGDKRHTRRLAAPASSPVKAGVAMPTDNTTDASASETATPPSIPLEGERNTQSPNGTRAGQQNDANAHGEGLCTRAEQPSRLDRPPSTPLEGEHLSSGHADDGNTAKVCRSSCDSKRVKTGPPAEAGMHQVRRYMHRPHDNVPRPCTPLVKCPKRPTKPANPPRRRGRLKTQPAKIRRVRAYAKYSRSHAEYGRARPIGSTGSIGYRPTMLGEHPSALQDQSRRIVSPLHEDRAPPSQNMWDAPRITKSGNHANAQVNTRTTPLFTDEELQSFI